MNHSHIADNTFGRNVATGEFTSTAQPFGPVRNPALYQFIALPICCGSILGRRGIVGGHDIWSNADHAYPVNSDVALPVRTLGDVT